MKTEVRAKPARLDIGILELDRLKNIVCTDGSSRRYCASQRATQEGSPGRQPMSAEMTIEAAADEAKTTRALRVSKITREAQDIASFELVDPLGLELPPFTAGAHLDVRINDDVRRQYSLCNDPQERDRYVIAVLNEPAGRGRSRAMHEQTAVGSAPFVSPPRNRFPLAQCEPPSHLVLAGGIAVTRMLARVAGLERRASPGTCIIARAVPRARPSSSACYR